MLQTIEVIIEHGHTIEVIIEHGTCEAGKER